MNYKNSRLILQKRKQLRFNDPQFLEGHQPEAKFLKIQELLKEYNFNICEPELRDILSKTKNMRDVEGRMKNAFYKWEQLKFVSVRD